MSPLPAPMIRGVSTLRLVARDLAALADFYRAALGFRWIGHDSPGIRDEPPGPGGGASRITLGLGAQTIELLQFQAPGADYPSEADAADPVFQHFAIVVRDMRQALARLAANPGWRPISSDGPVRLPAGSGGVTAFKFRDPEGHPLELLAFPVGGAPPIWSQAGPGDPCLGIDHTAIVVADAERSIAFYRRLGFAVRGETLNAGPEQARLDGLPAARARVVALAPPLATPHIELLCYDERRSGPAHAPRDNDIAATRVVLATDGASPQLAADSRMLRDPDGHRLIARIALDHENELARQNF